MLLRSFGYCLASSVVALALIGGGRYSAQEKAGAPPKPDDPVRKVDDGPPPAPLSDAQKTERFLKIRSDLAKRSNGALLEAKVVAVGDNIEVRWTLEYDGPRPPLVILEPSLESPTEEQTKVWVYAVGKDERVYEKWFFSPPRLPGLDSEGRGQKAVTFLTVPKGERAAGTISLDTGGLRAHFLKIAPEQFEAGTPPPLYVQLTHAPKDRGDVRGNIKVALDAWTGSLLTRAIPVPKLAKW